MLKVNRSSFLSSIKIQAIFAVIVLTGFLFSLVPAGRMQERSGDRSKGVKSTIAVDVPAIPSAPAITWTDNQPATRVLGQPDFVTATSGTGNNKLNGGAQAVVDPTSGKVFVADYFNNRVLRFTSVAAATNGGAAEAVLGQPDFVTITAAATASKISAPNGLAVDTAGRLWVADQGNHRVLRFNSASTKTTGASADGVLGQTLFTTGASATTQNGMFDPTGVFVDSAGRLWVGDQSNQRVTRFDNAAAKANGANADGVLGQTLFTTNVVATTQSGMSDPAGVVVDSAGRLWVADSFNSRVLRFDNAAAKINGANADGVLGQPNFITVVDATTQNGMRGPNGVAVDSAGLLYVADSDNNRVLIFNNAATLTNGANASNVLGQPNFTTGTLNTSGVSASSLYYPVGLLFDEASQNLFVGDGLNNRILRFGPTAFVVNSLNDNTTSGNALCTLREAIQTANNAGNGDCGANSPGDDVITFSVSGTIILGLTLPSIASVVGTLTINGGGNITVSGNNAVRVFIVDGAATATFQNLTIANGSVGGGNNGGGIHNSGTLTIDNSTISGNFAAFGGGIFNAATLTISKSTFSGNSSDFGGGILSNGNGQQTISNTTFSGNTATNDGGGINNQGMATIINSTFSGNSANFGGGIRHAGTTTTLTNTIVANSTTGGNCGGAIADGGNNLDSANTCAFTVAAQINTNPNLGALTGSPAYFPLNPGSPARDKASNTVCAAAPVNNTSQNGITRPVDGDNIPGAICDIGSVEALVPPTLGDYPNTTVVHGSNTTIAPIGNTAPTGTTSINVSTDSRFKGTLTSNTATGVLRLTNSDPRGIAPPVGPYTVTVKAFGPGGSTTKTFTLTVTNGVGCATSADFFTNAPDVSSNTRPRSVVIGDFNNDGKQDIAVANDIDNTVSIRLGVGDGTFGGTTNISVGPGAISVAAGDFNNDGNLDFATANYNNNAFPGTVSVRLGNGSGTTFSSAADVSVGADPISVGPNSIVVGDFNKDGNPDLAVANFNSNPNTVSIRLGNGAGGFTGTTEITVGSQSATVALGDFNNDGNLDFATSNQGAANVSIRLGDGSGVVFSSAADVSVGTTPNSVAIGDFNNDGNQDLATTNRGNDTVSIRLGNGAVSPVFSGTTNVTVGSFPQNVAIGDFNNDGNQDLAAANGLSNTVSIRLGNGAASPVFSGTTNVFVGSFPVSVAIGDFNGDGRQDFATAILDSGVAAIRLAGCSAPTAAGVSVSGRVTTAEGRGLRSAIVTLTDQQSVMRSVITSSRGYYRFADVEAGQTYVIAVRSRRFQFDPRIINVTDKLSDVDFIASP